MDATGGERTGPGNLKESHQILGHDGEIVGEPVEGRCTLEMDRDTDSLAAASGAVHKTVVVRHEMPKCVGQMTKPSAQLTR